MSKIIAMLRKIQKESLLYGETFNVESCLMLSILVKCVVFFITMTT